jgi:hypothetical protein
MRSNLQETETGDAWRQVAPLLDSAIATLRKGDRDAVVLRFVEGRELAEVGQALGTNESSAQRRVHRAVEKLRKFFTKRGVVLSGSVIVAAMAANSAPAAPAALAASVTAAGVLKGAAAGASTLALINGTLKLMLWGKLKAAAGICAGFTLAAGTTYVAIAGFHNPQPPVISETSGVLSTNSPFVRYLSNPPWIKKMQFAHGNYTSPGFLNTNPPAGLIWSVFTNALGVQPSGSYFMMTSTSPGIRVVAGVDDQVYWSAWEKPRTLEITPVTPDARVGTPMLESMRPRIEELQYLGLRGLRPGTFAIHKDGSFTATTLKDEPLEGKILKVSNDRPLALTYHFINSDAPVARVELTVNLTYQYASTTDPLPASIGRTEKAIVRQRGQNGTEMIQENDRSAFASTNYILSVEYGLDESISNGYTPSMFFPDVDQYKAQVSMISNGVTYVDGVARPKPGGQFGGQGAVTNRAGK